MMIGVLQYDAYRRQKYRQKIQYAGEVAFEGEKPRCLGTCTRLKIRYIFVENVLRQSER